MIKAVCWGDAGCCINLFCFPLVLVWQGLRIYLFGCLGVLGGRFCRFICQPCLYCCGWQFTDTDFELEQAIGGGGTAHVEWVRAADLLCKGQKRSNDRPPQAPTLYEGKIEAADLAQGAVGTAAPA